jgi:DMSO/TMAO reductase YedYZ molybdopterin-dependent catalytic subunit
MARRYNSFAAFVNGSATPLSYALTETKCRSFCIQLNGNKLDITSYRLQIDGAVRNPLSLTYQQLRDAPAESRTAILECAGNSRVFLVPSVQGAQWELGAVGNAEWTGVPLSVLLERAGLEDDACEIVLEGPDRAIPKEGVVPPGRICYARSLTRAKALQPDVLIAYQMTAVILPLITDTRCVQSFRATTQWLQLSG